MNIGVDILKISRIHENYKKFGMVLAKRILSFEELKEFIRRNYDITYLASRFSCKESIIKALNHKMQLNSIAILNDTTGAPVVFLSHEVKKCIKVSISHEQEYVFTAAISYNNKKN